MNPMLISSSQSHLVLDVRDQKVDKSSNNAKADKSLFCLISLWHCMEQSPNLNQQLISCFPPADMKMTLKVDIEWEFLLAVLCSVECTGTLHARATYEQCGVSQLRWHCGSTSSMSHCSVIDLTIDAPTVCAHTVNDWCFTNKFSLTSSHLVNFP